MSTVKIVAHRGASGYAPENTFAAFDRGLAMGAHGLETDIRATSDHVLVLMHDARVDRTCNGTGLVEQLTLKELEQLDAGITFSADFAGQRVPLLEAFLNRYADKTMLWLELKAPGVAHATAAMVQRLAAHTSIQYSAFHVEYLADLRAALPTADCAFLTPTFTADTIALCKRHGIGTIGLPPNALDAETVAHIRTAGLDARGWGVDSRASLEKAIAAGVSGLTLNWPDWALSAP